MTSNTETVTRDAFNKFFDKNYGSNGNTEMEEKALGYMTPDEIWDSMKRIEEAD